MTRVSVFDGDPSIWDAFVPHQTGWTPFHLFAWRRVIENTFGHECSYLSAYDASGAVIGILPLVRVRSRLFGHYLMSMPFLNYGGPLGSSDAVSALVDHAVHMARERGVKLLELRSRVPLEIGLAVSHRKLTLILDLPRTADELWTTLSTKMRNKIRKPEKSGVEVRFGPDQAIPFWRVFAHHMRDLGTPTLPSKFFEHVRDELGPAVTFACAYHGADPIAAGCGFVWDDEFELTWSSALTAHRDLRANFLLHWRFMEEAANRGVRRFNFGRSSPGSGTYEFKRQWGAHDEALWWYQFSPGGEATTPSPSDPAYAWGPRLWKHLPLPVANRLGPLLVRNLP